MCVGKIMPSHQDDPVFRRRIQSRIEGVGVRVEIGAIRSWTPHQGRQPGFRGGQSSIAYPAHSAPSGRCRESEPGSGIRKLCLRFGWDRLNSRSAE